MNDICYVDITLYGCSYPDNAQGVNSLYSTNNPVVSANGDWAVKVMNDRDNHVGWVSRQHVQQCMQLLNDATITNGVSLEMKAPNLYEEQRRRSPIRIHVTISGPTDAAVRRTSTRLQNIGFESVADNEFIIESSQLSLHYYQDQDHWSDSTLLHLESEPTTAIRVDGNNVGRPSHRIARPLGSFLNENFISQNIITHVEVLARPPQHGAAVPSVRELRIRLTLRGDIEHIPELRRLLRHHDVMAGDWHTPAGGWFF